MREGEEGEGWREGEGVIVAVLHALTGHAVTSLKREIINSLTQ